MYTAAVITVSDSRSAGEQPDTGGPLVREMLTAAGYDVVHTAIVPDEQSDIEAELVRCADGKRIALIITTGGTGFGKRDVTPEATLAVCERLAPGIPEALRYESLKITNRAMLTRQQAGLRGDSLIVNLPGSPKAIRENLSVCLPALEHGLLMLRGSKEETNH
jgi:molybdenum cofactor synthesis domain-containing protein